MLKSEKETVINFDEVDDTCHISTYNEKIINRLRRQGMVPKYENTDGSCYFVIDKNWVRAGKPKAASGKAFATGEGNPQHRKLGQEATPTARPGAIKKPNE